MPRATALTLFWLPVLVALGVDRFAVVEPFVRQLESLLNRLPASTDLQFQYPRYILLTLLVLYSCLVFMKQWSHYFDVGTGLGGLFVSTCGSFNHKEWFVDRVIAFWHGLIFLSAIRIPDLWLPCMAIYFFIARYRCTITLKRAVYASYWSKVGPSGQPQYKNPFSTFPNAGIVDAAQGSEFLNKRAVSDEEEWALRLDVMRDSLDWKHRTAVRWIGDIERALRVKEIFVGWSRILLMLALFASVFTVNARTILYFSPETLAGYYIIAAEGAVLMALFLFDEDSIYWGVSKWGSSGFLVDVRSTPAPLCSFCGTGIDHCALA